MRFKLSANFVLSVLVALAWSVVIFLFSAQDGNESSGLSGQIITTLCNLFGYTPDSNALDFISFCIRKAAHMTEFGLLGLLVLNAIYLGFGAFKGIYPSAFVIASIYAASDEIHQLFVPGRSGQFTDWLIDNAGILLWLIITWGIIKVISSRKQDKHHKLNT